MTPHIWDSIVIGGGAAGLSAAQALGRSRRRTLVIDEGTPRNRFASHIHNVLGHDGMSPAELLARGRAEAERYGVEFRSGSVRTVRDGETVSDAAGGTANTVVVELDHRMGDDAEVITARALVVATGVSDVLPEIPGLAKYWGGGVLHCPYCHGWEVRDQKLAVVTSAPAGVHQARLLRQWSNDLTVFTSGLGELPADTAREFSARGVVLDSSPVVEIVGDGERVTAVRTFAGDEYPVDAVFALGTMMPHDDFLSPLGLRRSETPAGSFLEVDFSTRTSHPRIWAAGNVVNPAFTIPQSMGAGAFAGAALNGMLVEEDYALAAAAVAEPNAGSHAHGTHAHGTVAHGMHARGTEGTHEEATPDDPLAFWEQRYGGTDAVWSGRVNRSLADVAADWEPGRSLDLGCGEGGDVLWLASRGWDATGVDLSTVATRRAREAAAERGLAARFIAADLGEWAESVERDDDALGGAYELVTASFLQSPVELPRERILRAAAERVAPGGRLVIISHAAPPAWAPDHPGDFPSPADELALLDLDAAVWTVETAEVRARRVSRPNGEQFDLEDTVVVALRGS